MNQLQQKLDVGMSVRFIEASSVFNGFSGQIVTNRRAGGKWGVMFDRDGAGKSIVQHYVYAAGENLEPMNDDDSHLLNLHRRYMAVRIETLLDTLDLLKCVTSIRDAQQIIAAHIRKNAYLGYVDVANCFDEVTSKLNEARPASSQLALESLAKTQHKLNASAQEIERARAIAGIIGAPVSSVKCTGP